MKISTVLLVFWTLTLLVVLLSPIQDSIIPNLGGFQHWDKVAHFGLFAVTGFVSVYGTSFLARFRYRVLFGLVFGLALAVGTEVGQSVIPERSMSLYDLLADLAGLFLGLLFYALLYSWEGLRLRLKL